MLASSNMAAYYKPHNIVFVIDFTFVNVNDILNRKGYREINLIWQIALIPLKLNEGKTILVS